ncbi:acetyltransferase [Nisaea sp.]|uniref:acetyltransferase n=1 Tax=Nisaea sp. TaxID=2024842 RepID=UPI0032EE98F9
MPRVPVHIVGCGGHAKVIAMMVEAGGQFDTVSFIDRNPAEGASFLGRPIQDEGPFLEDGCGEAVIIALGEGVRRREAVTRYKQAGFSSFPAVMAPSAEMAEGVLIGEGSVLMPGVIVNPGTEIGAFCVLNTGAILEHDCTLGDYAALAPGATVGGDCRIGAGAYIGIGAAVSHGRTVGPNAVIGGGSFLASDAGADELWGGVPAVLIRKRAPGATVL